MTTPAAIRFRDVFRKYIPNWMSDRGGQTAGLTVGFRYLWSMIAPLDAALEVLVEGLNAAQPGVGTPTALPYISRMRGILRGEDDTDDFYVARLRQWLDLWRAAGSAEAIAGAIQAYLANHPKVRIVTRSGYWVTLNTDGTIVRQQQAWDWDSVSNPERSGFWSEIWIIVYPTEWSTSGPFLDTAGSPVWGDDGLGIGHDVPRVDRDALLGLVAQWKSAHTKVRAILWTSDSTKYDPSTPLSLPNGNWGTWSVNSGGTQVASDRDLTATRYWEPA